MGTPLSQLLCGCWGAAQIHKILTICLDSAKIQCREGMFEATDCKPCDLEVKMCLGEHWLPVSINQKGSYVSLAALGQPTSFRTNLLATHGLPQFMRPSLLPR